MYRLTNWINNVNAFQFFQLFRAGSAILISILLAKSQLEVRDIAIYEWLLYIGMAVSFFWVNAFLQALLPIYPKLGEPEKKRLILQVFVLFCGISTFLCLLLSISENQVVSSLSGRSEMPYFHWYLAFLLFNLPTALVEYIYLLGSRSRRIVLYGALSFGLYFLAVVVPVFVGWGLGGAVQAMVGVAVFRFLWLLSILPPWTYFSRQVNLLKEYIWLCMPLIMYTFLAGFATVFDNWLVGWYYENDEPFAIFRYGARELPLATALAAGLSTAMIPEVAKNTKAALALIKAKSLRIFHWLFPLATLLMLTSSYLYPWVYNADFAESAKVFNVYLLVIVSRVLFPYSILMGLKKTRFILWVSIAEMLLNVLLSILLVPHWGLEGIAAATALAFLFEKLAMIYYIYSKFGYAWGEYIDLKWYFFYSSLLVAAFLFCQL